eukprot:6202387-Pleurochrysis_carterae.AAC.2
MGEPAGGRATATFPPPTIPLSRGTIRHRVRGGAVLDAGADEGIIAGLAPRDGVNGQHRGHLLARPIG